MSQPLEAISHSEAEQARCVDAVIRLRVVALSLLLGCAEAGCTNCGTGPDFGAPAGSDVQLGRRAIDVADVLAAPKVTGGWLASVRERAAEDQRQIRQLESGVLVANLAAGERAFFDESGVRVLARGAEIARDQGGWSWQLQSQTLGRSGKRVALRHPRPRRDGARVLYARGHGLVEEWHNKREGLEHRYVVESRPRGDGRVAISGQMAGDLRAHVVGQTVELRRGTRVVLEYQGLHVEDASGRVLRSGISVRGSELVLWYEDDNAQYPVVIDPLVSSPSWQANPTTGDFFSLFGRGAASAGDVNDDGYDDVIVGARGWSGEGSGEGRAYLYLGSSTGLSDGNSPDWVADPTDQDDAQFGSAIATAGDVNGDGFADVIVGAYMWDGPSDTNEGKAYLYHGFASGLSATPDWMGDPTDYPYAYYGGAVATAGDINDDGYSDVIIGAYAWDGVENGQGRAFVYLGSSSGLQDANSPHWFGNPAISFSAHYGESVAAAGDVNNDGYSDIIIGAPNWDGEANQEGRVYLYLGSASGLSGDAGDWIADPTNQENGNFGESVASAGDVNGDGFSDVIIGAEGYTDTASQEGRAYVYLGSATGLSPGNSPDWTADPANQVNAFFGSSVAGAGDVDNDGFSDVIVGATQWGGEGRAYVYFGSPAGLTAGDTPDWTADPTDESGASFGNAVASAGDVNGDGFSDVIVGASWWDGATSNEGIVFVYHGQGGACTPSGPDDDCNGADEDCSGTPDDNYVPPGSSCGQGVCAANGLLTCVGGSVVDTCTPGAPLGPDDDCNGTDEDCSGTPDDNYVPPGSSCGQGVCAANGLLTCVGGSVVDTCTPDAPLGPDDNCNGTDEDCSGTPDDNYVPPGSSCGQGVCAANGLLTCVGGSVVDTCTPGAPLGPDDECNGTDEDCSGTPDDNYVPPGSSCGQGVCAANGLLTCVGGSVVDTCTPGAPLGPDDDCNGTDEDCSGTPDDNYVPPGSSCGQGVCAANGVLACAGGVTSDTCVAGTPLASDDATCDAVDDDCDGFVDEDVDVGSVCGVVGACETAVCDPISGMCETSRQSLCCTDDAACATPSSCWSTHCDQAAESCVLVAVPQCCGVAADCDDGYQCTTESCNASTGECSTAWQDGCCQTDADCNDNDPCTFDECADVARCQHRPIWCGDGGPCGDDSTCVYSSLQLSLGEQSPSGAEVSTKGHTPILQIRLTNHALPTTLQGFRFVLNTTDQRVVRRGGLVLGLHLDADADGRPDANREALASAVVEPSDRSVTFSNVSQPLTAASVTHFVVTARRHPPSTIVSQSLGISLLGLLLLPMGRRFRRWKTGPLGLLLATCLLLGMSCSRSDITTLRECVLLLQHNHDVVVNARNGEAHLISGAPVATRFHVRM